MEILENVVVFLKEFGGVNVIAILVVYFSTAMLKNSLPLNRLKDRIKKLLLIIIIPLSISFIVSIIFILLENNYSFLEYMKQVLINWSFSGLAHKIIQFYLEKKE
jgi:hypothetical protein